MIVTGIEIYKKNMEVNMLVTKEYLIEEYNLTENEIEGVDLDALIEEIQVTKDTFQSIDIHIFLQQYKEYLNRSSNEKVTYYQYMREDEEICDKLTEEQLKTIKRVALCRTSGTEIFSVIIDYEQGYIYYGEQVYLLNDGATPTNEVVLDEKKKEILNNLWIKAKITSWENEYIGSNEGTTGNYGWSLYFELENGQIIRYRTTGVLEDNAPDEFGDVITVLNTWNEID